MNNIVFIVMAVIIIAYILISIRQNRLSIVNSFIWLIFCLVLLILAIWPTSLDWLAVVLGISYPPALFLTIAVVALFIMNFVQSKKIEDLQKKIVDLGQEISVLKFKSENKGTQKKDK